MQTARIQKQVANRFTAVDEVSDRIFEKIVPIEEFEDDAPREARRVRTRLLRVGDYLRDAALDFHKRGAAEPSTSCKDQLPFGWIVVVSGPGRGASFSLSKEISEIGRAESQDVQLDFGDPHISRMRHATIHYDEARQAIAVRSGGKANPVLLNKMILQGEQPLNHRDRIKLGLTTLRFVAIDDQQSFWSH